MQNTFEGMRTAFRMIAGFPLDFTHVVLKINQSFVEKNYRTNQFGKSIKNKMKPLFFKKILTLTVMFSKSLSWLIYTKYEAILVILRGEWYNGLRIQEWVGVIIHFPLKFHAFPKISNFCWSKLNSRLIILRENIP